MTWQSFKPDHDGVLDGVHDRIGRDVCAVCGHMRREHVGAATNLDGTVGVRTPCQISKCTCGQFIFKEETDDGNGNVVNIDDPNNPYYVRPR